MNYTKLLLHVCCGPCATAVNPVLEREGWEVTNLFYNPNIHPYDEYCRRYENFFSYLQLSGRKGIAPFPYQPMNYFQEIKSVSDRCLACYRVRFGKVAEWGKKNGFNMFTTTLTISPYQDQDKINLIGEQIARDYDMSYLKRDFRSFYQKSVEQSKEMRLYRQKYCGCLLSQWEGEKKRLWRSLFGQKLS